MRRKITHGREAAEKLARKWFADAGVPQHMIGFSENEGFYLVIHCMSRGRVQGFAVPCWGASVLRREVDDAIKHYRN
tara:strand:+ start:118 stop:348 length:231 start_codon:yes stop_codon:yes gene_type:complete